MHLATLQISLLRSPSRGLQTDLSTIIALEGIPTCVLADEATREHPGMYRAWQCRLR